VPNEKLLQTELPDQKIRINSYQLPAALNLEPYRFAANCVPIEKHDKLSEQALVHTLGGVLKPLTKNIMDIIRERADMSIMRTVLEKTNLSAMLEDDKPVTIFVPTDAAFDKLEPHLRRALKEGRGCASSELVQESKSYFIKTIIPYKTHRHPEEPLAGPHLLIKHIPPALDS